MSRYHSYLNTAKGIVEQYKNEMPLHAYLKNFFSQEKKYGSKDRKMVASLCYYYFRLGHGENSMSIEDRILVATFLCENEPSKFLEELKPEWNEKISFRLQEKLLSIANFYSPNIFPWGGELSREIEAGPFSLSFLIQPKLFLRIRPGMERKVSKKLEIAEVAYEVLTDTCIAFNNGMRLDDVLEINKEVVVQDYSSQRVGEMMEVAFENMEGIEFRVWDCCAASGGKSILAHDLMPKLQLTVTDVRPSILHNLQQRFQQAGIKSYRSFLADLRNVNKIESEIGNKRYDLIICDAPCSGSGTWGRTPEELYFFKPEEIERFAMLQRSILTNIVSHIDEGGQLLYITCSVFRKENEDNVDFITKQLHLELVSKDILKGYAIQADTMFAALFKKV